MFKNYLKTALRSFLREKGSSVLNIAGLTSGIACSLILFLLIRHLATFDNFHSNRDRIYRVVTEMDSNNERFYTPGVPAVLPEAFRQEFQEAEEVTFFSYRSDDLVRITQPDGEVKKFQEERGIVFAEPASFRIFDRPLLIGEASKALDEPSEAIISRSLALKYFGREDVLGQVVQFDTVEYTIRAVMEDAPDNTDFPFSLMLSYITIKKAREENQWNSIWSDEQCYILLKEHEVPETIMARMPAFVEKYLGKDNYRNESFTLQPLREIHFDSRYSNFNYNTTPKEVLVALGVVAIFLIVSASINFINLTTAEAVKRSKEVGIRKSLGSSRQQLVVQFLGETAMVTVFSMLLALGLAQLALTFLNAYLELPLALDFAGDAFLWVVVIGITAIVSLLSGLYPSVVLSGFKPVLALKNRISGKSTSGYHLRRGLVVVQFLISQFFIIGTIVLLSQMHYFRTRDLGFRKDAVLVVPVPEREYPKTGGVSKLRTLRDEIGRIAGVENVSLASTPPSSGSVNSTNFYFAGEDESASRSTHVKLIDANYLSLYDIPLVAGKNLQDLDKPTAGIVVNEQFVRVSGLTSPEEILGRTVHIWDQDHQIVGVVRDFHTVSLRDRIEPTVLMNGLDSYNTLSVRVNTNNLQELVNSIQSKWEVTYPSHIFDYVFLDENIREFYEAEEKMSVLLTGFTGMAIFIGCLGLFGLASFMANQKVKEIGVRKVLGASVESIVFLFSKEYIKLVVLGFLLAAPISWYIMNKWLETFAYKIELGPAVFFAGFGVTFIIAVLTVGYKSFAAAIMNPVKSLRYE